MGKVNKFYKTTLDILEGKGPWWALFAQIFALLIRWVAKKTGDDPRALIALRVELGRIHPDATTQELSKFYRDTLTVVRLKRPQVFKEVLEAHGWTYEEVRRAQDRDALADKDACQRWILASQRGDYAQARAWQERHNAINASAREREEAVKDAREAEQSLLWETVMELRTNY